jgi:flagellar biosynthetic protein FliR
MGVRITDPAWVMLVMLASVRVSALFVLTPVLGAIALPARLRAFLGLTLTAALVAAMQMSTLAGTVLLQPAALALAALSEVAVGAAMAFGLFAAFGAFQFAGKLLDIQIGFSLATIFDPATRTRAPLLGSALNLLGAMLFFAMDGHHLLMRGLAFSFQALPVGQFPRAWSVQTFTDQFGVMFLFGLTIAAPVLLALLLLDIGLGIASRTMPQLNIFTVGIPVKIVAGLLIFIATVSALAPVTSRIFETVFTFWQRLGN